jgi:hypothetical protein
MSLIVPYNSQLNVESALINGNAMTAWKCRLFSNNVTFGTGTNFGSLTECTFTGYSAVTTSTWSSPALDGSNRAASLNTQAQFTPTAGGGSGNIYGYYLTDSGNTLLYGGETLAGGPLTVAQNVTLEIDITWLLVSLF